MSKQSALSPSPRAALRARARLRAERLTGAPRRNDRRAEKRSTRRTVADRTAALGRDAITTPGKMAIFALLALAFVLVAGLYSANTISNRQQHHETLLADIEPVANASQTLYSSLTIADSAANTAFITGGLEPKELRDRYLQAIARSSSAIVAATQGLDRTDQSSVNQLATINAQLNIYTGLVETARSNNRIGNPVGSAYLATASALMQDTILPTAADFYDRQSVSVGDAEREWSTPPWSSFALLFLAIAVLLAIQRWLWKLTGRRINIGLALATICVVVVLLWTMVAGLLTANNNSKGLSEGAAPMNELTRQRINAQKVRAQETLNLVRRTDPEGMSTERADELKEVRATLVSYLDNGSSSSNNRVGLDFNGTITAAINALDEWVAAQNKADSQYQQGDYQTAIRISAGQNVGDSGYAFDRLDGAMQQSIDEARKRLRTRIDEARKTSTSSPDVLMALSTLSSLAIIGGIAPRIREYL